MELGKITIIEAINGFLADLFRLLDDEVKAPLSDEIQRDMRERALHNKGTFGNSTTEGNTTLSINHEISMDLATGPLRKISCVVTNTHRRCRTA
jgi:hypothetical protein